MSLGQIPEVPMGLELAYCCHLEGWDREGGREAQEGGDVGIYVYI